jgi:hypothetical protein
MKFPKYTKKNPSPEYFKLIDIYSDMHKKGKRKLNKKGEIEVSSPEDTFPGKQTLQHAGIIKQLCDHYCPSTMLDFGSGKSNHYNVPINDTKGNQFKNLKHFWGLNDIDTYEPALESNMPDKKYDSVICTDVIEHVFFGDVFWTLQELFKKARMFVYVNISCDLTKTYLPNNENVHITVRSPDYWNGVIDAISSEFEGIDYILACTSNPAISKGNKKYVYFQRKNLSILNDKFTVS